MSLLTDYLALPKVPAKQTLTATSNGQASFATAGYTPGLVNVFIGGSRLDPAEYTATDGVNVVITNSDVIAQIVTGMVIDIDASFSSSQTGPVSVSTITNAVQTQVFTPLATSSGATSIGFLQGGTGAVARPVATKLQEAISVKDFGAVGNGTTDDTAAVNAAYTYARTLGSGIKVVFPRGTYLLTSSILATGVSTEGYLATLNFTLNSSNSYAFSWGASDTYVTGIRFQLANSGTTAIQGILNAVSNVKNQKFFGNRIIASTTLPAGGSNIYGHWFTGTGLNGLYFYENHMEACSYGFQLNNQNGTTNSVITNPLGNPTYNVFVHNNTFEDCALGVNTPHIFCYNVNLHHNNIRPVNFTMDLPLNIAHVNGLSVTDNIVTANKASNNGVIHLEDVTQAFTLSGNKVVSLADNTGIMMSVQSGISHDNPPIYRGVIINNHLYGGTPSGAGYGIVANDSSTTDMTISNNYISNFGNGIETFSSANIEGNTIVGCLNGIAVFNPCTISNNTIKGATNAYFAARAFSIVRGGTVYDAGLTPTKNVANSGVLYENLQYQITSATITSNVALDIFPLPATKFNGTVVIGFGSNGFLRATINWDGTTFTATTLTSNLPGVLGAATLTRNASTTALSASMFVGGGGTLATPINVTISGLVY